jgi:hypothetical protein
LLDRVHDRILESLAAMPAPSLPGDGAAPDLARTA